MKKFITIIATAIMSMAIMVGTASAASTGDIHDTPAGGAASFPAGYIESIAVDAPDDYFALGTPLVAWDWSFLDYIALEKGYMVVESITPQDILRIYTKTEGSLRYTVTIYCDSVIACVHDLTNDFPGAIVGYPCVVEGDIVSSEYDFVTDLFGTL